jgi:integrase
MRKGVADLEQRIWLPDALTGTLWSALDPNDADELLAPVIRNGKCQSPSDAVVFRRIGALINQLRVGIDPKRLPGIEGLRRSAREFAFGEGSPVFVAYDSAELPSESVHRGDVPRLFPGEPLLQFETPPDTNPQPVVVDAGDLSAVRQEPAWIDLLISKTQTNPLRVCLSRLVSDSSVPEALRLLADFGIALDSRTPRYGKRMPADTIMDKVIVIARCLGLTLDSQNLAALDPVARRTVYLDAINQQPVRTRSDAVQAVIEFDRYLVAKSSVTLPVLKSSLPWLPKDGSVDPGLITHAEYLWILDRIEAAWPAKRGERQRKMMRLLVMLAFRCGLRRSEMRSRRIEDLLILGFAELQVPHRKEDPLKTRNAERRLPIGVLISDNKRRDLDKQQEPDNQKELDELQELIEWLQRRISEGAKATDYLFSTTDGKRIPTSLFGDLNKFLRKETQYANEGKGIHLHHLRHAAGAWLFVSLMFGDSKKIDSLFPQLHETHLWLKDSKSLRQRLCGHTLQTRKVPFIVACFCGHGSFDTTASSYINIFPWLVAHEIDGIETMRPDAALVRMASKLPSTTFRTWRRAGGLNNIPVQLLVKQGARDANPAFQNQADPRDTQSAHLPIEKNWLMSAWERLVRRGMGESEPNPTVTIQAMFARADWLRNCQDSQAHARHPVERVPDKRNPTTKVSLAAPLMSGRAKSAVDSKLLDSIARMSVENGKLLGDAVGIFTKHLERDGFVRFDSISELRTADRYIKFLRSQGFEKRELELVSGDADIDSQYRRQWRLKLSETYLLIRACSSGRNYGPKTSIWIRPKVTALANRNTSAAGFRLTMEMAFIVFGAIPVDATSALPAPAAGTA